MAVGVPADSEWSRAATAAVEREAIWTNTQARQAEALSRPNATQEEEPVAEAVAVSFNPQASAATESATRAGYPISLASHHIRPWQWVRARAVARTINPTAAARAASRAVAVAEAMAG